MARYFNVRRTVTNYSENVEDASDRLSQLLAGRHFVDMRTVPTLMNELRDMNLANIEANLEKAEATITAAEALRDVFKNLKKWKEAQKKIMYKDEVARMKNEQKERRKMELDSKMNIPGRWSLPDDPDDEEDLIDL